MRSTPLVALVALAAPLVQAASLGQRPAVAHVARGGQQKSTTLRDDSINSASTQTGLEPELKPEDGQTESATDDANFINFCSGKTLTNGEMSNDTSCSPIVMGDIPAAKNMISTVITAPQHADTLPANKDFDIEIATSKLSTGSFTNPLGTYYAAPQQLTQDGHVIGHVHLVVQDIGDLRSTTPPNPQSFAFFAGLNDKGHNGALSTTVAGGLPPGAYRLCTLVAAANHQPVLMPVAQRGGQDDCVRFTVTEGGESGDDQEAKPGIYVEV